MSEEDGLYMSYLLLIFSILFSSGLALWLYQDTDVEKYVDYRSEYRRLHLYEQFEDASKYRSETLADFTSDELDEIWLSTVQEEQNINLKLQLYLKLLKANPEREASYKEIAVLINSLTDNNKINVKQQYLKKLNGIPGAKNNLLEKYGLETIENE